MAVARLRRVRVLAFGLLLVLLLPAGAAHPSSECLQPAPRHAGPAKLGCTEHVDGANGSRDTTVTVYGTLFVLEIGHDHDWTASGGGGRCYVNYMGMGPSIGAGRSCPGVWHDALP